MISDIFEFYSACNCAIIYAAAMVADVWISAVVTLLLVVLAAQVDSGELVNQP